MKKYSIILLLLVILVFITSCRNNTLYLEDATITLSLGLDHNENNSLVVYQSNPVFSKNAQDKYQVLSVDNILNDRQSRTALNATADGFVVNGKVQVLLLGKKLLETITPLDYLDTFYRDPKNAVNIIMIAVDGPVSDIMNFQEKSTPLLAVYIKDLIDTAYRDRITVKTELDDFHTQLSNKGVTPYITEIKKGEKNILITGCALLKNDGTYATSLNKDQSSLLMLLQGDTEQPANLSFKLSESEHQKNAIGIVVQKTKRRISTNYIEDKFHFDIEMDMDVNLLEWTYGPNAEKDKAMLEKVIREKLQQGFYEVITTIQDHAIDPIGLGNYARAYQYQQWKEVQNDWGEALANAEITVSPKVKIRSLGGLK